MDDQQENNSLEKSTANSDMIKKKTKVAKLSVLSNFTLVVLKFIIGIATNSVSVISEAIHSGLDLIAAVIAYFAVRQANNPPDEEHNFGHGKIENISGAIEALLIFIASIMIVSEAIKKIIHPHSVPEINLGIIVMGFSALINWIISNKLMKVGRETESLALEADAWHLRTDVYTSLGVLIGLVLMKVTKIAILDPIFAIGVAIIIMKAAYELTTQAVEDLMDKKLPDKEEQLLKKIIQDCCPLVIGFHRFRTRKSGNNRFVDVHLVLPRELSLEEAHDICDQIECSINKELPNVEILIHVEPEEC